MFTTLYGTKEITPDVHFVLIVHLYHLCRLCDRQHTIHFVPVLWSQKTTFNVSQPVISFFQTVSSFFLLVVTAS